jgi:putative resolvase
MIESNYFSIGETAILLGICTKTLRRWETAKVFEPSFRTVGKHRRYARELILSFISKNKKADQNNSAKSSCSRITHKRVVVYARVSATRQKTSGDLSRQLRTLQVWSHKQRYRVIKEYSDVGSGLNDNRKGLLALLRDVPKLRFQSVIVHYQDRLSRFGIKVIGEYLRSWGVTLEVVHPTVIESSPHAELITDLTAILYSFMGKLYRMRRKEKDKTVEP